MKKRILRLFLCLTIVCSMFVGTVATPVSAAAITEESFASKIAELQNTFIDGQYWNKYSSSDYSHTGTIKCRCSGSYCLPECSCYCGQFYYNNKWYGGQCHGYAIKLGFLIFGSVAPDSWKRHYNAYNVYAGDLVRIKIGSDSYHSFFVTKVVGDTIYYTECNYSGPCLVKWNRTISKATLASKLSYVLHNPNYTLSGTGTTQTIVNPIHSTTNATIRNGFFTIKNVASGTYLNVWGGTDSNGTPITTYSYDDSTDQQFNFVHQGNGKYKIYPYCSSIGTNRVVDIFRNNQPIAEGQKVNVYDANDDTAQLFYIVPLDDGSYVFEIASKDGYVIAPPSAYAGSNDRNSQLTVQRYTGANHQKWKFCNNNGGETYPVGTYSVDSYKINTNSVNLTMRDGAGTGYSRVTSIPDGTTINVTQINGNWGYTSYNGYSGWVCLDYCIFSPSISNISVYSKPYIDQYFTGEKLDANGLVLTLTYSNNSTQLISTGFTTNYDFSTPGTKTVTVTYEGKTTSFTVNVIEPEVIDVQIATNATKTSYYVGDTLDTTNLSLLATYNNGDTKIITSGYTTNYDFSTAGTKTVTVTYEGKSVSYDVTVENRATATVIAQADKEKAYYGDEVTVLFDLENTKDVFDGNFNIAYDNTILKIVNYELGETLNNCNSQVNSSYASNKIRVTFAGTKALTKGNILKVTFKVIGDKAESANVNIDALNMYAISGGTATVATKNANIGIGKHDYTITDMYFLNDSDKEIEKIPQNGKFYAGIKFNKNVEGTSRPNIIFALYDVDGKMICMKNVQNRYSQGDGLTCETEFSVNSQYNIYKIKVYIWESIASLSPLSNILEN